MDLNQNLKPFQSVTPQDSAAATIDGASFDARDYKQVVGVIGLGAIGVGTTVDAKLQDSDDNATWADVPGQAITQKNGADDDTLGVVGSNAFLNYRRHSGSAKRYLRIVITVAGGATANVFGLLLGGKPTQAPAS